MKYELGDKVRIKKYWRPISQRNQLKSRGIGDLEEHLRSDDMQGDTIELDKFTKETIDEVGLIVGTRDLKLSYELMHVLEDAYAVTLGTVPEVNEIRQVGSEYERVYLVATRMNCLRRVSFEDIEYIGGGSNENFRCVLR